MSEAPSTRVWNSWLLAGLMVGVGAIAIAVYAATAWSGDARLTRRSMSDLMIGLSLATLSLVYALLLVRRGRRVRQAEQFTQVADDLGD